MTELRFEQRLLAPEPVFSSRRGKMNLAPLCLELEEDYKHDMSYQEDLISSTESDI